MRIPKHIQKIMKSKSILPRVERNIRSTIDKGNIIVGEVEVLSKRFNSML